MPCFAVVVSIGTARFFSAGYVTTSGYPFKSIYWHGSQSDADGTEGHNILRWGVGQKFMSLLRIVRGSCGGGEGAAGLKLSYIAKECFFIHFE